MGIRRKTTVIYLILLVSFLTFFFLYSNGVYLRGINQIEVNYANDNLMRAENVLKNQITNLDRTCKDWAYWDDTYQFIQNRNQDYISSNLIPDTMKNLNLNFMILINSDGNIVHRMAFDSQNDVEMPIPPEFNDYLSKNVNDLISAANEKEVRGLLFLDEKPLIISVNSILKSTSEGPSRGILIMGRYLSESEISKISDTLKIPVYIIGIGENSEEKISFERENYILAQKVLNDINDKPAVILNVETPREIFQTGRKQIYLSQLSIILIGTFFILASLLLMDRIVLSRLTKLRKEVVQLSIDKSSNKRINVHGDDEISYLADDMNNMLQKIEDSEKELEKREKTLQGILSSAPVGINLFQNRIWVWSNQKMQEITGYSVDELMGKSPRLLYESEEEYKRVGEILYKIPREENIGEIETRIVTKEGRIKDVYVSNSLLDSNDPSKGYITIVLDITDRKISKKQLDANVEYFAHLVDHIRNPLAIMSGFIQVEVENVKTQERLLRQIDRIEELIKQLDHGWMDTEDTRRFMKRYM